VNYFSQSKPPKHSQPQSQPAQGVNSKDGMISTIAPAMTITGQIVCVDALQVHGRIQGEVHACKLVIAAGALVDGDVTAQDAVIEGEFKGTIRANTVKLSSSAVVNGDIHNRSMSIDQNAQFEGVARRLEKPVESPAQNAQSTGGGVGDFSAAKESLLHFELSIGCPSGPDRGS
jgi:cytoskeletal protein CcmA (bactofilin family)